ncbi:MAG TPA: hypothetical protein VF540_00840, partial [Segetibacter sp.]
IFTGLKSAIANGNTDAVTSLFNSGSQGALSSPVTRNIQDGFVNNLMQKFGLDHGKASGIATSLIPIVLQKLVHKTNDPNDKSFDLGGILGNLTGGSSGGGMLGKITGMFN